jgi:hypothetical protein
VSDLDAHDLSGSLNAVNNCGTRQNHLCCALKSVACTICGPLNAVRPTEIRSADMLAAVGAGPGVGYFATPKSIN